MSTPSSFWKGTATPIGGHPLDPAREYLTGPPKVKPSPGILQALLRRTG